MPIDNFIDWMKAKCKRDDNASDARNEGRYHAEDFSTQDYTCRWNEEGVIHMLATCSNHPRFSLMKVRKELHRMCAADRSSTSLTADGKCIDFVIGIIAVQGHSRVRAPAHMFGWRRVSWKDCPILFHQSPAANHDSIVTNGLYPGGIPSYTGRNREHGRWATYCSMADGHRHFPNTSMIDGVLVKPYKHHRHGTVYCLSTYFITEVLGVEVWSTAAHCAMVMGWISKEAITFAFNCATGERVYQDKARHIELIDQAQEVVRKRLCVQFQHDEAARAEEVTRAADAVARGETIMPKQHHDVGPTPPKGDSLHNNLSRECNQTTSRIGTGPTLYKDRATPKL